MPRGRSPLETIHLAAYSNLVWAVTLVANLHLTLAAPNALILETVRTYTRGFYQDLVTTLPRIERGYAYPLTAPGLGTASTPTSSSAPTPACAAASCDQVAERSSRRHPAAPRYRPRASAS